MSTVTYLNIRSDTQSASVSKALLWAGRIMSGPPALFLLADGITKLVKPPIVVEATMRIGYTESVIVGLAIVQLTSTVLYLIPRTAVLGPSC